MHGPAIWRADQLPLGWDQDHQGGVIAADGIPIKPADSTPCPDETADMGYEKRAEEIAREGITDDDHCRPRPPCLDHIGRLNIAIRQILDLDGLGILGAEIDD